MKYIFAKIIKECLVNHTYDIICLLPVQNIVHLRKVHTKLGKCT